ncbi:MAG: 4-hydroxy-tetrahydrodipicolinate synthase [Flavobacteriaceae bacterium]|nr:4-hydroxy-tetrahydrodipicolinate synthase [Flavobacteriaceae bacterium]
MEFLKGSGVAMITPFDEEGRVDYPAVKGVVDHIISGGIDYIVLMGTTAETATLTSEERAKVVALIVEVVADRVPLILGIGGNNTQVVVDTIKQTDLTAFKALMSVCPYYTRPSQEGIYQHFKHIATASPIPVILYNVPARTGVSISNETTVRLATDCANIIAIKDATGDLESVIALLDLVPDGFHVISGDDALALPVVLSGGSGVISVIGGALPNQVSKMIRLALENRIDEATVYHNQLLEMIDLIFREGNPAGVKNLSKHLGLCTGNVRLPLVPASEPLSVAISEANKVFL